MTATTVRVGSIVAVTGRFQAVKSANGYVVRHSKTRAILATAATAIDAELTTKELFEADHFARYEAGAKCLD